jgi:F-type H+-transporting ATPase subunit delta
MSNALTLARPYARAAFSLARDHGRLKQWSSLLGFASSIAADDRVRALLSHPLLVTEELMGLLLPPGEVDPTFRQFIEMLGDNGRLPLLPEIAGLYEQARADEERTVRVKITSATPLGDDEVQRLVAPLKARFGREVIVSHDTDPDLIGGAVIDAGDVVIDGSVRGKLRRLQAQLAQ